MYFLIKILHDTLIVFLEEKFVELYTLAFSQPFTAGAKNRDIFTYFFTKYISLSFIFIKKCHDMFSNVNAAHPLGCDSPLHITQQNSLKRAGES